MERTLEAVPLRANRVATNGARERISRTRERWMVMECVMRRRPGTPDAAMRACPTDGGCAARANSARGVSRHAGKEFTMIRKLSNGEYRLYSRQPDPKTGKRRNLGTFGSREQAEKHEREVQYFKRQG
jgi:hypothetical protein